MTQKSLEDRLHTLFQEIEKNDDHVEIHISGGSFATYVNPTEGDVIDENYTFEEETFEHLIDQLESHYDL